MQVFASTHYPPLYNNYNKNKIQKYKQIDINIKLYYKSL